MIGSLLTRGLVMLFGYAYPAYECYKTVELNKPEIEQLRFWCQYWILVAILTVGERIGDAFISWVPMYSEAKLAFFIYLWYPKTKGTSYVYDSFFRPYMAKHETEIDRNLLELRTKAGDIAILYWQRAASYGQTRIYEILQYVAAQSTPKPHPLQPQQQQGPRIRQHVPPTRPPTTVVESEIPSSSSSSSSSSSTSSNQQNNDTGEEGGPSSVPKPAVSAASSNIEKAAAGSETTSPSAPTQAEPMQTEAEPSIANDESANPPPKETVMEEAVRPTRGRLRRNRSTGK